MEFPLLGRQLYHQEGKKITWIPTREDLVGADFYTGYIPKDKEFRVWVWRGKALGTYLKGYKESEPGEPPNFKATQWIQDGFQRNPPQEVTEGAIKAVRACGLDFGAVDVLVGKDRGVYVLEVNSAPGIDVLTRVGPRALARRVVGWVEGGFPKHG